MLRFLLLASFFLLLSSLGLALAYTPTDQEVIYAERLSRQLNRMAERTPSEKKGTFVAKVSERIDSVLDSLIPLLDETKFSRMYLLEYLKRHLPGTSVIEKEDIIYDEQDSTIWNDASNGFDILYNPYETPSLYKVDAEKKYRVLLNGGYFLHNDTSIYHSGVLAFDGDRYTPFVMDDSKVTHFFCQDLEGRMHVYPNAIYSEMMIATCPILFQAGPLFYSKVNGLVEEDLQSSRYIGKRHKRTILILFESKKDNTKDKVQSTKGDTNTQEESIISNFQSLWFLTINEEVTLAEARNIILRETRFMGEYDNISLFNLDGGSSVAHMNREYPELNIGRFKVLPTVIGIP